MNIEEKRERIREGLYTLRFVGRYGKYYKLSYPDVKEVLQFLQSEDVKIVDKDNTYFGRVEGNDEIERLYRTYPLIGEE